MVNLILTKNLDSKYLLAKLKNNYDKGIRKHLFVVPDRVVLSYEMLILDYLNLPGTMDIEVVSFRTLSDKINEEEKKVLNQETETMLIRKIIEENQKAFKFYRNATNYIGFASEVLSLIALIRGNRITLDDLSRLANSENLPDKYKNKAHDILLIYSEYVHAIQESYSDYISNLEYLIDNFDKTQYSDYQIYISEFDTFSQIELDIIESFIKNTNVYISFPYSNGENDYIFPISIVGKIKDKAAKCQMPIIIEEEYKKDNPDIQGPFKSLYENLYSYNEVTAPQKTENIKIVVAKNPEEEIKNIAIKIKQLVKDGNRYKDIACICCDTQNYHDTFERVFKNYKIPYFSDAKEGLLNQNLTKILVNALRVNLNGFLQQDVFALLKEMTGIYNISDINDFENYCLKFGIEYKFKFENEWYYAGEKDARAQLKANKIRRNLMEALEVLDFKESLCVKEYIAKIKAFLEHIDAKDLCDELSKEQSKSGNMIASAITDQVYEKLITLLDQYDAMLGTCIMKPVKFCNILFSTIAGMGLTTIPMYLDCIYVGDLEKSRYEKKKYIFIVGANESLFPKEAADIGLVCEDELQVWNKLLGNKEIYPNLKDANRDAKLNVLMAMLKAKEKLYVSYPLMNMQSEQLEMAHVLNEIGRIIGQVNDDDDVEPIKLDTPSNDWTLSDYIDYIGSKQNVLESFIEIKHLVEENRIELTDLVKQVLSSLYNYAKDVVDKDKDIEQIVFSKGEIDKDLEDKECAKTDILSTSKLEKYFACPFAYCMEHTLKLQEREVAGVKPKDTGTILHACFEKYFSQENYLDKTKEQIVQFVVKVVNEQIDNNSDYEYLRQDVYKYAYDRLIKNATDSINILVNKMISTKTEFVPYALEARFADSKDHDGKDPKYGAIHLKTKNGDKKIVGVVDRIDKVDDKVFILDYKSKNDIDYKIQEIVWGQKIQSALYLKKVSEEEKAKPVGAFYLPLGDKINKESKEDRMKYVGIVLDDLQSEKMADGALFEKYDKAVEDESELFPLKIKVTKNGKSFSAASGSFALNDGQMKKLLTYVEDLVKQAAEEIDSGYIKVSPIAIGGQSASPNSCRYCNYKNICKIDSSPDKIRRISLPSKNDSASMTAFLIELIGDKKNE